MTKEAPSDQTLSPFPHHIAIIMDGNGRWALRQGLPNIAGHKAGAETLKKISKAAAKMGVTHLTAYAFSTENWSRPIGWVQELMELLKYYLKFELKDLIKNDIRLHVIGDRQNISNDLAELIDNAIERTKKNTGLNLIIALSYGARREMVQAAQAMAQKVLDKSLKVEEIDEAVFSEHLYTSSFPEPDLLIRTSGELRVSNFLLWQIAYTELFFTKKLWPEFKAEDLKAAISDYQNRERRYGTTAD